MNPTADDRFEWAKQAFLAGLAQMELGHLPEAQHHLEQSLAWMPGRTSTLVNLAAVRLGLNRADQALPLLEQACNLDPGNAQAWAYRGQALKFLQQPAGAAESLAQAVALQPGNPVFWISLSEAQIAAGLAEPALASLDRLLTLTPQNATAWSNRGMLLRELQRPQQAAASFEKAVALLASAQASGQDGQLALNQFYLAAAQAEPPERSAAASAASTTGQPLQSMPPSAPRAYVEKLFDGYATDFDAQLVQGLQYRAPEILLAGLRQRQANLQFDQVLDLGCGSGLCGPLLRPVAHQLHGLDLSSVMLQKAGALGVYDQLFHADAVEHLQGSTLRYNLVLAADVLIYIGALEALFAALVPRLAPGGQFVFTVEQLNEPSAAGVQLLPSLRYAHSEAYLRRLATANGLVVDRLDGQTLRHENGHALAGLFVYLRLLA